MEKVFSVVLPLVRSAYIRKKKQQVKRVKIDAPEQEMARYEKAKAEGIKQLQRLYDKALREVGKPMQQSSKFIR